MFLLVETTVDVENVVVVDLLVDIVVFVLLLVAVALEVL